MGSHNYMHINYKRYKEQLSPFGNKVLSMLIKQWNKACIQKENEYQPRQYSVQNKRVLTFNDESISNQTSNTPLLIPSFSKHTYLEENSFHFNIPDTTALDIPKSLELIKTVPKYIEKDDFLHPNMATNNNVIQKVFNKDTDNDLTALRESPNDNTNVNSKNIEWDDMLDTAFFNVITANEGESKETNTNNMFNITFPNEDKALSKKNTLTKGNTNQTSKLTNKGEKRKIKKETVPKPKKIKSGGVGENHSKLKEIAKQVNKKNSYRKEKYTKTVKNWLDNVKLHHTVDKDLDVNKCNNTNIEHCKTRDGVGLHVVQNVEQNKKSDIMHVEKMKGNQTKTAKKVVQAQLANKDGIMKFSKPKVHKENQETVNVPENKQKDTAKEKKGKKFVVPIKSQIPVKDITYEVCTIDEDNVEDHLNNLQEIKDNEIIALLIYSNGFCQLNSHHTDGTCVPDGLIISNGDMYYCFKGTGQKLKKTLKHVLKNNKVVCHGAQGVLIYLASQLQMEINAINIYDAKIGASLLDPDNTPENFSDLQKLLSFTPPYTIVTECPLQKSAWYMSLLRECWTKLCGMLAEESLWKVFVEIEMKLLPIIAGMQLRGICIDMAKLKSMEEVLLTRMKLVEQQCYKAAGKVFQINSTVQVRAILYDELQLDTKCNIKIRETICKGAKSTSETMLRSLVSEHPLPRLILEYRHLHKAHATFVAGIAQHVEDGVVRPTWVQTAAATGRIASNNPNLQAIPKAPFSLVMFPEPGDDGGGGGGGEQLMFRSVYVSRRGRSLVAADFQHVECRVFAHAAADTGLAQALSASEDFFKLLAAKWLKKPEAEIIAEERERTKRLVYASLYGAGTRKLMEILEVDYQQALQVAASFNRTFPSLKEFGLRVVARCASDGARLASLCGRVRRFPNIASDDFTLKSHAERQAVNFIVQGSAADLCKSAMIATEQQLRASRPALGAQLLLQIHDELVWEVLDHHVHRAAAIIKQVMEECGQACGMAVSLPVALSVGKHWGDMQPYAVHPL